MRPFCLDEEGSMVIGATTGVGSNGIVLGSGIRFYNLGKVGKMLVGCLMVVQSAHGCGTQGWEESVGSFLFLVPRLLVVFPPIV